MRESQLEARIRKYAESRGTQCRKYVTPGHRASPDRQMITRGGFIWYLEIKRRGEEPTALQYRELNWMRCRNIVADWTDNFEKAKILTDAFEHFTAPPAAIDCHRALALA